MNVVVLLPDEPPAPLLAALPPSSDSFRLILLSPKADIPSEQVRAVLWVPPSEPDRIVAMLDRHPEIEWIHSLSAGVDKLSELIKGRLQDSAVILTNGRGAFSSSLAEYAIAAMFHFNKQIPRCQENKRHKRWDKFVMDVVAGKTMGFVGYGHIAQSTALLAAPFGLRLVALRRHPERRPSDETLAATYGPVEAAAFYAQCDFVVCSLPLTPDTHGIVGRAAFEAMKPEAVFISLGRGACVDETALHEALSSGRIRGAACDVFATEPLPESSPLWECDNLLLSAHNADLTSDYFRLAFDTWAENLDAFCTGKPMVTLVDKTLGY